MVKSGKSAESVVVILLRMVLWITGVLVALAVGFGMIDGFLLIPGLVKSTVVAGWIVVILTVVGAVLAIIERLTK